MQPDSRPAIFVVLSTALAGLLAPLLANDRPILARVDGHLTAPALAELPIVGRLFDDPSANLVDWGAAPAPLQTGAPRVLLMPPVPYSYRGIRLDEALRPPSRSHWMGTDALGRDLLARVLHGTRLSIMVGFGATAVALLIGFCLGALARLRAGLAAIDVGRLLD